MENDVAKERQASYADLDAFCRRVLSTIGAASAGRTFGAVADEYMEYKYGQNAPRVLSESTHRGDEVVRSHVAPLDPFALDSIPLQRLQETVNGIESESIRAKSVTYIKQIYRYAVSRGYIQRDESALLHVANAKDAGHGVPFSDEELSVLWAHKDDPNVASILIMCYSGFRVTAYKDMEVNTNQMYFRGGVKTAAGKNRIVPIHSAIQPLIKSGMRLLCMSDRSIRRTIDLTCAALNISRHTSHDCRHTFSRLCEKYHVPEADRKRMLGHSFGFDITNAVYGHRTLEELRQSIELIVTSCDK